MKKRVMVIEDDAALARVLCDNLVVEGFEVNWSPDGRRALQDARDFSPDLILLDLMLPGLDGFELFGQLRQARPTPIVVLTARGQKSDKLKGLNLGADDYITKPFDLEELLARLHAVLRRSSPSVAVLRLGDLQVDFQHRTAVRAGLDLRLTHRELELLRYLSERPARVVSRGELLKAVWGYSDMPDTRSVDHAIARLRRKIEPDLARPRFIHTVHGDGYMLTPQGAPTG